MLKHPLTGEIRYVGITTQKLEKRLNQHLGAAKANKNKTHCASWIRLLLADSLVPIAESIGVVPISELNSAEVHHIAKYLNEGARLTNHTSGGRANYSVSKETRKKQSIARRKRVTKAETRVKQSRTRIERQLYRGEKNPSAVLNGPKVLKIYSLLMAGCSRKEVSEKFKVTKSSIHQIARGQIWKHLYTNLSDHDRALISNRPIVYSKGIDHPVAKLTNENVLEIYKLRKSGLSCVKIGEKFKVSKGTISRICKGQSWSHLYHHYLAMDDII